MGSDLSSPMSDALGGGALPRGDALGEHLGADRMVTAARARNRNTQTFPEVGFSAFPRSRRRALFAARDEKRLSPFSETMSSFPRRRALASAMCFLAVASSPRWRWRRSSVEHRDDDHLGSALGRRRTSPRSAPRTPVGRRAVRANRAVARDNAHLGQAARASTARSPSTRAASSNVSAYLPFQPGCRAEAGGLPGDCALAHRERPRDGGDEREGVFTVTTDLYDEGDEFALPPRGDLYALGRILRLKGNCGERLNWSIGTTPGWRLTSSRCRVTRRTARWRTTRARATHLSWSNRAPKFVTSGDGSPGITRPARRVRDVRTSGARRRGAGRCRRGVRRGVHKPCFPCLRWRTRGVHRRRAGREARRLRGLRVEPDAAKHAGHRVLRPSPCVRTRRTATCSSTRRRRRSPRARSRTTSCP